MRFPVVLHTDNGVNFGVIVPDVAGCFSAGNSVNDALNNVKEALALHLQLMVADGEELPRANSMTTHQANLDYKDGLWAFVDFDIEPNSTEGITMVQKPQQSI